MSIRRRFHASVILGFALMVLPESAGLAADTLTFRLPQEGAQTTVVSTVPGQGYPVVVAMLPPNANADLQLPLDTKAVTGMITQYGSDSLHVRGVDGKIYSSQMPLEGATVTVVFDPNTGAVAGMARGVQQPPGRYPETFRVLTGTVVAHRANEHILQIAVGD